MKRGVYFALSRFQLLPAGVSRWIEGGQTFTVEDEIEDAAMVLVHFDGLWVWKYASALDGKVKWMSALPGGDVINDRVKSAIELAAIAEERIPLDDLEAFAHGMGVILQSKAAMAEAKP